MKKTQLVKFAINQLVSYCLQKVSLCSGLNLHKPLRVILFPTASCNLRCRHCSIWKCKNIKELSTEEWEKIIADLKSWLGPFFLCFNGGEPLLRKDTIELIEFASKLGIMTNLCTNGTLISKEIADRLICSRLDSLSISLDGINSKTHDSMRGRGTYEKVISNISYLIKSRKHPKIIINTVLMDKNLDEIIDLIKWEKNRGLSGQFQALIDPPFLTSGEYDSRWYKKNTFWPKDTDKIIGVIDDIILMKKNGYSILNSTKQLKSMKEYFKDPNKIFPNLNCTAGVSSFFISSEGYMHFCPFPRLVGNLKKQSAKEIWLSKKAADLRKQIKKCKRGCILLNCNFDEDLKSKIHRSIDNIRQKYWP